MAKINPFFKKKYVRIGLMALVMTWASSSWTPRTYCGVSTDCTVGYPFTTWDGIQHFYSAYIFDYIVWFVIVTLIIYLYEFDKFKLQLIKREEKINKKGE